MQNILDPHVRQKQKLQNTTKETNNQILATSAPRDYLPMENSSTYCTEDMSYFTSNIKVLCGHTFNLCGQDKAITFVGLESAML